MTDRKCAHGKTLKERCLACESIERAQAKHNKRVEGFRSLLIEAAIDRHYLAQHIGVFSDCGNVQCVEVQQFLKA